MNEATRLAGKELTTRAKAIYELVGEMASPIDDLAVEGYLALSGDMLQALNVIQDGLKQLLIPLMMIGTGAVQSDENPDDVNAVIRAIANIKGPEDYQAIESVLVKALTDELAGRPSDLTLPDHLRGV